MSRGHALTDEGVPTVAVVRHQAVVEAPRDKVFAYVSNHENVPKFMFGLTKFEPTTELTSGVGATYDAAMEVGPKSLGSIVETVEWVDGEALTLQSVKGFSAGTKWRFTDVDGGTSVDVEFTYKLPGGLAGKALSAIIGPFAAQAIKQTEANIREGVAATV